MQSLKPIGAGLAVLALLTSLSGCSRYPFSAEDKVNAAFPLPDDVLKARSVLEGVLEDREKKTFHQEWTRRLTLRALTCSKDYHPSWYSSLDEVRGKLSDLSCFRDQDEDTARWLGFQRVGVELAKPALRPVPAMAPKLITGDEQLRGASFASDAGIAALVTAQNVLLMDLNSGQPLRKDKAPDMGSIPLLSPNGRLLVSSDGNRTIRFRNTESGEEVGHISATSPNNFLWLGKDHGIFSRITNNGTKAVVVNFLQGKETELPFSSVSGVYSVPGAPREFVLMTNKGVAKVELASKEGNTAVNLLDEQKLRMGFWARQHTAQTADEKNLVGPDSNGLSMLNTETLAAESVDLGPGGYIQAMASTADPDKVVMRTNGIIPTPSGVTPTQDFLYSLSAQTFTLLENPPSGQLTYVPALKTLMVLTNDRLMAYDPKPAAGEPITAQQVATERRLAQAQRQMEAADRMAQIEAESRAAALQLPNLPTNARIESIGVYQGPRGPNPGIQVRIQDSGRPLVLVLSSYEAVRWQLMPDPGVKILAVLLSGYKASSVNGVSGVRVLSLGTQYAYQSQSPGFRSLDEAVLRATGKRINNLQGAYEGSQFSISGR